MDYLYFYSIVFINCFFVIYKSLTKFQIKNITHSQAHHKMTHNSDDKSSTVMMTTGDNYFEAPYRLDEARQECNIMDLYAEGDNTKIMETFQQSLNMAKEVIDQVVDNSAEILFDHYITH